MASLHTPRELELIIKHELRRERDLPDGLIVQILRVGDGWRADSRFGVSRQNHQPDTMKAEISRRVAEIGSRIAKEHRLIG